jgi:hypothetical protein
MSYRTELSDRHGPLGRARSLGRRGSEDYELGALSRRVERRRSPRLLALHIESDLTKCRTELLIRSRLSGMKLV